MSTGTAEGFEIYKKIIKTILINWKVFSMIVQDGYGGEDSFEMGCALIDDFIGYMKAKWFSHKYATVTSNAINEYFISILEDNYDIEIESEAILPVSKPLMTYYTECYQGKYENSLDYINKEYENAQKKLDSLSSLDISSSVPYVDDQELENIDEVDMTPDFDDDGIDDE
ncbi:hypothetical protein WA158_008290 [Blastocystis sp. Blastoise]